MIAAILKVVFFSYFLPFYVTDRPWLSSLNDMSFAVSPLTANHRSQSLLGKV